MNRKVRITKKFTLELAHALENHEGHCQNIHGHSYKLYVTLAGIPKQNENAGDNGMVMDFDELTKIVNTQIIEKYDHTLLLHENSPLKNNTAFIKNFPNTHFLAYTPTCENLIIQWAALIKSQLAGDIELINITLYETEKCSASYYEADNLPAG